MDAVNEFQLIFVVSKTMFTAVKQWWLRSPVTQWGCRGLSLQPPSPLPVVLSAPFDRLMCWLWDSPALSRELLTTCSWGQPRNDHVAVNNGTSLRSSWVPIYVPHTRAAAGAKPLYSDPGREVRDSFPSSPPLNLNSGNIRAFWQDWATQCTEL